MNVAHLLEEILTTFSGVLKRYQSLEIRLFYHARYAMRVMTRKQQDIPELDIGDPRDHWSRQAHKLASQLKLPVDFINEAGAIVEGAFSPEWLDMVFGKARSKHTLIPLAPHPLDTLFCVAGGCQVVELMELAAYLKRLEQCPRVADVITVMKDHYATGFLQLAFTYRFQRAGATKIELEPPTDRGRSDIYFRFSSRPYLVECYVPSLAENVNSVDNLRKCAEMVFAACDSKNGRLRVSIRLKRSISVKEGKHLGWWLANQIRPLTSPYSTRAENEIAWCEVKQVDLLDDEGDRPRSLSPKELREAPDAVISQYGVPARDIEKVRLGEQPRREEGSRLVIWRPQIEKVELSDDEYVQKLEKRISDKLKQTKRQSDNPGRIVVAQLGMFKNDEDRALRIAAKLQQILVPRYENVSAIMLVHRSWVHGSRYQFRGIFLGGRNNCTIPQRLFETIQVQEETTDVLEDYK